MTSKYEDWWWLSRLLSLAVGAAITLSMVTQVFLLACVGRGSSTTPLGLIFGPIYGVMGAISLYAMLTLVGFIVLPRVAARFQVDRGRVRVVVWCLAGLAAGVFATVAVVSSGS
jgi:hypothetical protein